MLSTILGHSGELYVSSSCIGSPSSVQISGSTYHRSIQTSYCSVTLLDGGYLAFHSSQHGGRHSLLLFYHKKTCHGCFSGPGTQGSTITAFKPLAAQRCVLCRGSLPQSVRQWQQWPEHLWQKLPAILEEMGKLVCSRGCTKQCLFCLKLADFWFTCFGLDWVGAQLVFIILLFQPLELIITRLGITIPQF